MPPKNCHVFLNNCLKWKKSAHRDITTNHSHLRKKIINTKFKGVWSWLIDILNWKTRISALYDGSYLKWTVLSYIKAEKPSQICSWLDQKGSLSQDKKRQSCIISYQTRQFYIRTSNKNMAKQVLQSYQLRSAHHAQLRSLIVLCYRWGINSNQRLDLLNITHPHKHSSIPKKPLSEKSGGKNPTHTRRLKRSRFNRVKVFSDHTITKKDS